MAGNYKEADNEHINRYKMAHMIGVAEYMRERAADYGLNPDVMYTVGLLHDIGYIKAHQGHEEYGAEILGSIGVDEDIVFAVRHHGENLREVEAKYGKSQMTAEFMLVMEADVSVNAQGYRVGFEGRLKDIVERYGKDSPAEKNVRDNIEYILEYQKENGIGKPYNLYHKDTRKDTKGR